MNFTRQPGHRFGIVLSDLHLFAHRSAGAEYFDSLTPQFAACDLIVLNGDIFDFRWSTLPDTTATLRHALDWLHALGGNFPRAEIHYVIGNHDCPRFFRAELDGLAVTRPGFHWHDRGVRLGTAVFVHGDCTHRRMSPAGLSRYRTDWDNDHQHARWRAKAYVAADRTGATELVHRCWFPRRATVARVTHYLDQASPDWRRDVTDCYFGHTHLPFSNQWMDGVRFHNTGSGIRGMGFNPCAFDLSTTTFKSLAA
jgi:UDP-2,3-diacylglucosamine pyrophosphatase LpxH